MGKIEFEKTGEHISLEEIKWFDGSYINLKDYNGESLAEKIALEMYPMPREEIFQYPKFIQNAYFIIDFDTELTMEGILGVLDNSIGAYIPNIIEAFNTIGDNKDADILAQIGALVSVERLQAENNQQELEEFQITSFAECHELADEVYEQIEELESGFYLRSGFDMWSLLFGYLDEAIKNGESNM